MSDKLTCPMHVTLISTYELGHQPFGLASPAAWLRAAGAQVTCLDLALQDLPRAAIAQADLVAFYLPMHTATRLAVDVIAQVKYLNPQAHLCCFGLYAPLNEAYLRKLGVQTLLGGEFESGLVALYERLHTQQQAKNSLPKRADNPLPQRGRVTEGVAVPAQVEPLINLDRQHFLLPDRTDLPELARYAFLDLGDGQRQISGYTEASRGCKHLCRHCPIVPVYNGRFRVVGREVVLADIRNQVAAGAQHITFGDPDFFNGPTHASALVQALHAEFPDVTYDVIIKIEHLLKHTDLLPTLRDTGCRFVTSAVEAVDDQILAHLDKGHTRADFIQAAELLRQVGLLLVPTFVAFSPWITLAGYRDLLAVIAELDLVEQVAPIQYAIRLLLPAGSRLLEVPSVQAVIGSFDESALVYPWLHPDPAVDRLQAEMIQVVQAGEKQGKGRGAIFADVWALAYGMSKQPPSFLPRRPIPHLSENWYC